MDDANNSNDDSEKTLKELQPNPLKKLSIDAIEKAFSNALSELTDAGYEVDVQSFKLGETIANRTASMEIFVRRKHYLGKSPFG